MTQIITMNKSEYDKIIAEKLRKRLLISPVPGYTVEEVEEMSIKDVLDMDFFLNENEFFAGGVGVGKPANTIIRLIYDEPDRPEFFEDLTELESLDYVEGYQYSTVLKTLEELEELKELEALENFSGSEDFDEEAEFEKLKKYKRFKELDILDDFEDLEDFSDFNDFKFRSSPFKQVK